MRGFNYDTRFSLSITDVDNAYIAAEVKLILTNILGDDETALFNNKEIPLYELDRQQKYDYSTVVGILPKNAFGKEKIQFFPICTKL